MSSVVTPFSTDSAQPARRPRLKLPSELQPTVNALVEENKGRVRRQWKEDVDALVAQHNEEVATLQRAHRLRLIEIEQELCRMRAELREAQQLPWIVRVWRGLRSSRDGVSNTRLD